MWVGVVWGGGGDVDVPCTSYLITRMLTASCLPRMRCSDEAAKGKNAPQVFQAFQSSNWHGTVVKSPFFKAMTLKTEKTRPKFFQDFQSSNWQGTLVKSPFFKKMYVLWERFPVRRDVYDSLLVQACLTGMLASRGYAVTCCLRRLPAMFVVSPHV